MQTQENTKTDPWATIYDSAIIYFDSAHTVLIDYSDPTKKLWLITWNPTSEERKRATHIEFASKKARTDFVTCERTHNPTFVDLKDEIYLPSHVMRYDNEEEGTYN